MSLFFLLPWGILLYFASNVKSHFLFFFVTCQFVFVGFGLSLFPYLGLDYLNTVFPSFIFTGISERDFNFASIVLLVCTFVVVSLCALLISLSLKKSGFCASSALGKVGIRGGVVVFFVCAAVVVSVPFLLDNYKAYIFLLEADSYDDLVSFVDFRRDSTSNYFLILFIYNVLPATSILSLLWFLERRKTSVFLVFSLVFVLASVCLLMTFQKRPLLVFWGASGLTIFLYQYSKYKSSLRNISFYDLAYSQKWICLFLILMLFVFYYFYTAIRFDSDLFSFLSATVEIIYTRLIGRLSIPAAMYVDFFPNHHEFYGLSNVGLLDIFIDGKLFLDSKVVFTNYTVGDLDGAVAASVFIDAYGQGGFIVAVIYGFIVAFAIYLMDYVAYRSSAGAQRVFFVVSGFVFIYYLSQSSLFRAAFGYGGIFYLLVWFIGIGPQKIYIRKTGS
ncbi:hypothetical protein C4565_03585 [Candidatus Parcubacteria bacterium]|nr:MAG: hypothetical protein C4565_03585 [Candidatus Parcubacteria bacterium]